MPSSTLLCQALFLALPCKDGSRQRCALGDNGRVAGVRELCTYLDVKHAGGRGRGDVLASADFVQGYPGVRRTTGQLGTVVRRACQTASARASDLPYIDSSSSLSGLLVNFLESTTAFLNASVCSTILNDAIWARGVEEGWSGRVEGNGNWEGSGLGTLFRERGRPGRIYVGVVELKESTLADRRGTGAAALIALVHHRDP